MKPVIIFQFVAHEGPGYLATFLDAQNIPFELVSIDKGDVLPDSISAYSGMVLMGGPMSANDDLPWMKPLISLILAAKATDIPC